jgi:hypothetical protein
MNSQIESKPFPVRWLQRLSSEYFPDGETLFLSAFFLRPAKRVVD